MGFYILISVLILMVCVFLVLVVLVQNSKGGGLAANFSSSNQNDIQAWMYSVGRYSLWGVSHSISLAAISGVPPEPLKPINTPAWANILTAAWVMDVPVPSKMHVVLAMGMFQYCFSVSSS